jgi:membrane protein implicated in regulation of membrane protease activity
MLHAAFPGTTAAALTASRPTPNQPTLIWTPRPRFFITTVAGLILEPVSAGAWALICVSGAMAVGALSFEAAFAAADTQVLWLIVIAFLLAKVGRRRGRPRRRKLRRRSLP